MKNPTVGETVVNTSSNIVDNTASQINDLSENLQPSQQQIGVSTVGEQIKNVPTEIWLNRFQCAD